MNLSDCIEKTQIPNIDKFCSILSKVTIHNFTGDTKMADEITLWPLFQALRCCEDCEKIVDTLYNVGTFTENARDNYYKIY